MSGTRGSLQMVVVCGALVFAESGTTAAGIKVLASNAVKAAYVELIPKFEHASGHTVTVDWGSTANIRKRVEAGAVADIVIVPSFVIDDLIAKGVVVAVSRKPVSLEVRHAARGGLAHQP